MFEQFKNKFPLSNQKLDDYVNCFKRIEVPTKTTLLAENQISQKVFFIEKGCVRVWFNKDGKDITFQFFFENDRISSTESFKKNIPSIVTIETIEPCTLWSEFYSLSKYRVYLHDFYHINHA